jgi:hypothetical protein
MPRKSKKTPQPVVPEMNAEHRRIFALATKQSNEERRLRRAAVVLPEGLKGVSGVTVLCDSLAIQPSGRGAPNQPSAVPMSPADVPSLCVDVESCAHDVVCCLADIRAAVVRCGTESSYGIAGLEARMRLLNMTTERLKVELRKLLKTKVKRLRRPDDRHRFCRPPG